MSRRSRPTRTYKRIDTVVEAPFVPPERDVRPRGRRVAARAIDFVIVFIASGVVYTVGWLIALSSIGCVTAGLSTTCSDNSAGVYVAAAVAVLAILLPVLYETFARRTLGKRILGLEVVTEEGAPLTRLRRFKRSLGLWVPLQVLVWGIIVTPDSISGWFFVAWLVFLGYALTVVLLGASPFYDKFAGTRVIRPGASDS